MPALSEKEQEAIADEAQTAALFRDYVQALSEFAMEFKNAYDLPSDLWVLGLLKAAAAAAVTRECVTGIPTPQIGKTWIKYLDDRRAHATRAAKMFAMLNVPLPAQIGDGQ